MCRVALVNPPDTATLGPDRTAAVPPLGLAYIASLLREQGFTAELFDLAEANDWTEADLLAAGFFDFDLYGFTAYTKTFPAAVPLISCVGERRPSARVLFGGPHATPCAEELLARYPQIDFVIRNDGEIASLELARYLRDGSPALSSISGLVYREPSSTGNGSASHLAPAIRCNPDPLKLVPLDDLPEPASDYRIAPSRSALTRRRHPEPVEVAFLSSSRGCPKRCTFCSIIVMSPKYRFRSVESLMAEIQCRFSERPFGHIAFSDPNFFVHVRRTLEFSRALHAWNPQITWSGTATADFVARHADVLNEIGARNCASLELGIESGSQAILNRFNKRTTVEDNLRAIALLDSAGIDLELDFIMFDPETTLAELHENMHFLHRAELVGHHPTDHLFNALKIYPGTPARDRYVQMFDLDEHHLMRLTPPFLDPQVAEVHRLATAFFKQHQPRIDGALAGIGRVLGSDTPLDAGMRDHQALAAVAIHLRHLPYHFFQELLEAVEQEQVDAKHSLDELGLPSVRRIEALLAGIDTPLTTRGPLVPAGP